MHTDPFDFINKNLNLDIRKITRGDAVKGWCPPPEGETGLVRFYFDRQDCLEMAKAWAEIAENLLETVQSSDEA